MRALALIEHVDRELDVVCLVKVLLAQRYGITLDIAHIYGDAPLNLAGRPPRVVLTPFFYAAEDEVIRDYVAAWPQTHFLNLAWEQLFYPSHEDIKAPRDAFARDQVTHLAWSRDYLDYLRSRGVGKDRQRLVGHALYRLYRPPLVDYFAGRDDLAARYGLDPRKRWVFTPENYRWAFLTDSKLRRLAKRGPAQDELFAMRDFCARSMAALMRWCDELARAGDVEVIFRPRPATSMAELSGFIARTFGEAQPHFRVLKDGSAREWVLASDVTASSYSTVLIEAAIAGKAIIKVEPEPTPAGLRYDWCDLIASTPDGPAFAAAATASDPASSAALRAWAEATFFPEGDPVERLVEILLKEIRAAHDGPAGPERAVVNGMPTPFWALIAARLSSPERRAALLAKHAKGYAFNLGTHEKDRFGAAEVRRRVQRWRSLLKT